MNYNYSITKTKDIILITDNRPKSKPQFSTIKGQCGSILDFRQSGFKQTQVDPLQVWAEINAQHQEESLICQLNKRIIKLQEKVKKLQKSNQNDQSIKEKVSEDNDKDKKHRRKFAQMERKFQCHVSQCEKIYGSQTSLKHHLKIKHNIFKQKDEESKQQNNLLI